VEKFSFFDTMLLVKKRSPPLNTIRCSCSSLISKLNENSEAGTCFSDNLLFPKTFCQIANNYLIGANSELIYLIDDNLKYVKSMCLIETLEMKQETEQKRHTTLINKVDLRLDTVSICYSDFEGEQASKKLFMLTSVHNQYFFVNVFDLEFNLRLTLNVNIKNADMNNDGDETSSAGATTGGFTKQAKFKLLLRNKFFVSHLSSEFLNKKILCNQNYLFICERNNIVRVFSKDNGRYLFSIKNHDQQRSDMKSESRVSDKNNSNNSVPSETFDELSQNKGKVKDICVDVNGNLYVAYNFSINVFNENCEFLWKYDFRRELINFRIVQISILKTNSIGMLVEDEKNNYSNKMYIFE
jgi:hypothetical protein